MRECLKSKTFRFLLVVLIWLFATAAAVFVQAQPRADSRQQGNAVRPTETASPDTSGYAGAETCKTCHDDIYQRWEKTPHWRTTLNTVGGPSKQGCEGCHGPAAGHAADPSDTSKLFLFTKATPKEVNDRCLSCHASSTEHLNSINSLHRQNDVSCISCHSPHDYKIAEHMLVKSQPGLCYTCHLQQKAQFNMPFHHRVNEGLIQCTDCHNPHGTAGLWESNHVVRQVRSSAGQDVVCFKCHADKQGPFVYEHAPVKTEGCGTCHAVHGGANPRMLKFSNINLLCLQCHTYSTISHAPVMDAQEATQQQACTLCHVLIHGSNFHELFFK